MKLGGIGENGGEINVKVFFTPSLKGRGKKTLCMKISRKSIKLIDAMQCLKH